MSDGGKSLIVSGDTLQADVRGIELVIFITLALVAAWLLAEVLSLAFAKIAENSGRVRRYIEEIKVRAALIPRLKKRREHLLKIVEQRNDEASTLGNRRNGLTGRLRKIRGTSDYFVREIGANTEGTRLFTFSVSNRYVTDYVAKNQKHPLLDDSWKSGQIVDVWSKSIMDARVVVAEKYSASLGYVIENIKSTKEPPSSSQ